MKLNHLLTIAALIAGAGTAWAQTDVTSTYITNADFEDTYSVFVNPKSDRAIYQPNGWTVTRTGSDTNDMTILKSTDLASNNFTAFTINDATTRGEQTYWTRLRWGNNTGLKLSQTKTLPAGNYKLTAFVLNYNQDVSNNKAEIFAGSNSVTASNSNTKNDGAGWKTLTVNFTLNESTEIEMGVKLTHATENSNNKGEQIVGVDNFKLVYTDFKAELRTVIAQAQAINARISTLGDDITTAQTTLNDASASKSAIEGAVSTLRTAISTKLGAYTGLDAAGDDITSFIVNNGFETSPTFDGTSLGSNSDPKSNATPTAGSTLLFNSTNVYQVSGWELMTTEPSDYARTFTMPYNNTLYVQSNNAVAGQAVASPSNGSSVTTDNSNLLFVEANWCPNTVLGVKQTIPLPAGSYRLTFDSYVTTSVANANSLCGVSYGETTNYKWPAATNTWTANEVDFTLTEQKDVTISMGYKKINSVSGGSSAFLFVDNVKLTYFDPLKLAQIQWQVVHDDLAALDATALPDAAEDAITDALAETEPTTVEGYNTAKAALQALIDSYDDIKAAYNKLSALITLATNEKDNSTGTKASIESAITIANSNIETRTTAADLTNDYNTLEGVRETYVTSGAQPTAGNVFDFTFKINDAAVTGTSAWGTARTNSGAQYTGAPDNTYLDIGWAQTYNMNQTVASLPAGSYTLKAATRAKSSEVTSANIYVNQSNTALNKSTDNHRDNNTGGGLGNGWSWSNVDFVVLKDGDVTVGFYGQTTGQGWAGADDFHLYYKGAAPMYKEALLDVITSANTLYNNGTNVGTGVFQIPESAGTDLDNAISDANDVYDDSDASASEITDAISALETAIETFKAAELNAPADGARYYLKVATSGHAKENNAIVVSLGATSDNNPTGYSFAANASPAAHIAGAYIFTPVPEKANTYYISVVRPEGTVYLTYGSLNGSAAGWKTQQIQGTTNAENKGEFKIVATSTANVFNIVNTVFEGTDNYIDCQDGGALYTDDKIDKKDFSLAEASEANVTVSCKAGKFGTVIFPFTPDVSTGFDGIAFYSCETVNGTTKKVQLTEVNTPVANVPYLIKNEGSEFNKVVTGWGTATADSYTEGLLTGVYTAATIAAGENHYVLQTQNDTQAFYSVDTDFTATAYKCYLTYAESNPVKALFLGFNDADAISDVRSKMEDGRNEIFNLAGQRLSKMQKGINIVNGKKVLVK